MFLDFDGYEFWLRPGSTDMRCGANRLAHLVITEMGRQPMERSLFIFCGSSNKVVKMLVWDHNGFWLATKRIVGRGGFAWPADGDGRQEEKAEEEGTEVKAHVRKKHKRHDLTVLPSTTPVLEIDHTEDCPMPVDPNTGSAMVLVGVKAEDKVGFIPAATYIERHLFPVYAPAEGYDGDEGESLRRVSYPLHTRVLKGVMVTDSLAAEVMAQKFCDHLPLYRQQDILARRGLAISRQSMARWIIDAARALKPLGALIRSQVLQRRLVNMDETTLAVLHEPGRESGKESYMMVQVGSGGGPPVVHYTYDRYHNADVLGSLIEGFSGVLQTDGLSGYAVAMGKLAEIGRDCVHLGCWSHARRGFTAMGKGAIGKDSLPFIKRIGKLYSIERELRAKWDSGGYADEQAFVDERVALTEEVLAGIHALAREKAERAMEGSEFSKALNYVLNQWPRLVEYPHHFDATPDNNAAICAVLENAQKPREDATASPRWPFCT